MDEAFIKKVQPNSPEAEQSVIGAMIMDRDAIADVIDIVNADDFYQKQNGILFEAMTELYREGKPVDLVTLQKKLKKKDVISSKNPRIVEQKTGKTRILYLSSLQELIQDYTKDLKPEDYLFPSTKGGHLEVNTVYQMFQKVAALLDRDDIGTHTLRKTFGYHYYKKTKDVATLMEIFGHSSEKITKRYIGINEDEISETFVVILLH